MREKKIKIIKFSPCWTAASYADSSTRHHCLRDLLCVLAFVFFNCYFYVSALPVSTLARASHSLVHFFFVCVWCNFCFFENIPHCVRTFVCVCMCVWVFASLFLPSVILTTRSNFFSSSFLLPFFSQFQFNHCAAECRCVCPSQNEFTRMRRRAEKRRRREKQHGNKHEYLNAIFFPSVWSTHAHSGLDTWSTKRCSQQRKTANTSKTRKHDDDRIKSLWRIGKFSFYLSNLILCADLPYSLAPSTTCTRKDT